MPAKKKFKIAKKVKNYTTFMCTSFFSSHPTRNVFFVCKKLFHRSKSITVKRGKKLRRTPKVRYMRNVVVTGTGYSFAGLFVGLKKDPGIPNLFPLKEQLLKQLAEKKQQAESDKERQKLLRQQEKKKKKKSLQGFQNEALRRTREFEKKVCPRISLPSVCTSFPPSLPPPPPPPQSASSPIFH